MKLKDFQKIPQFAQSQESLSKQLEDLILVANRLGFYDAADWIKNKTDINSILLKATKSFSSPENIRPNSCQ